MKTTYEIQAPWPCGSFHDTFEEAFEVFRKSKVARRIVKTTKEVVQYEPGTITLSTGIAAFEAQEDPWEVV